MPILAKLREFLEGAEVPYSVHSHPAAYTAQEIAALQHVKGHTVAKVVMAREGGARLLMLVLPNDHRVDFAKLKSVLGSKEIELASETDFKDLFPGSELGAMPPFGNLYGVPVYVAPRWSPGEEIVFSAGSHTLTAKMAYRDYTALVKPVTADFAVHV